MSIVLAALPHQLFGRRAAFSGFAAVPAAAAGELGRWNSERKETNAMDFSDEALQKYKHDRFPRSACYDPAWVHKLSLIHISEPTRPY